VGFKIFTARIPRRHRPRFQAPLGQATSSQTPPANGRFHRKLFFAKRDFGASVFSQKVPRIFI